MKTSLRIAAFFILTMILTLAIAIIQQALGISVEYLSLPQFGPGLAAAIMMLAAKTEGVRFTVAPRRCSAYRCVILLLPLLVPLIIYALLRASGAKFELPVFRPAALLLIPGIVIGAIGEEIGWRGYLQNYLSKKNLAVPSYVLIGFFWGLWHLGIFQNGALYAGAFIIGTVAYSGIMYYLGADSPGNILPAIFFHSLINIGFYLFSAMEPTLLLAGLNSGIWLIIFLIIRGTVRRSRII
jgi:membrane protease YdiL (CAAX protease family)